MGRLTFYPSIARPKDGMTDTITIIRIAVHPVSRKICGSFKNVYMEH